MTPCRRAGLTFVELLATIVVLAVIATLLVPTLARSRRSNRVLECAHNLQALWKAGQDHTVRFGGPQGLLRSQIGGAFWTELRKTEPPLLDSSAPLHCPFRSDDSGETPDYRGPRQDLNTIRRTKDTVIGADLEGTHGPDAGGNVLRFGGDVVNSNVDHWLWGDARQTTIP